MHDDKPILSTPISEAQSIILRQSLEEVGAFVDNLWLQDGLAKNTLGAYRSDLEIFSIWLSTTYAKHILQSTIVEITAFMAWRKGDKATSLNRRLTVLKRFFRYAISQNRLTQDPCANIRPAKQIMRFPISLSEVQVEALLLAPDISEPLGLRDRAMLELIYASGLRVSEIVQLKLIHVRLN